MSIASASEIGNRLFCFFFTSSFRAILAHAVRIWMGEPGGTAIQRTNIDNSSSPVSTVAGLSRIYLRPAQPLGYAEISEGSAVTSVRGDHLTLQAQPPPHFKKRSRR